MGLAFAAYKADACCLCGSSQGLTGEHKVKASALRAEFGADQMMIGRSHETGGGMKLAQSVKSKAFHFRARMCADCNNSRTQAADAEFDRLNQAARVLLANGGDPALVFTDGRYTIGSAAYLNVFRYFAKLLCCHMAEIGAPRPLPLSDFAIGQTSRNCVWLAIDEDWTYKQMVAQIGLHQYAAHGGLVVYGDKKTGGPKGFHSTLTLGPLRYVFFTRLNWLGALEVQLLHRQFHAWCRVQVRKATDEPLTASERLMLGLEAEETSEQ